MSDAPTQDRIELEVKDFGPILEASLDLRPLTVFIGPSNTGKSWLATLIYALHRCFGDDAGPEHWRASPGSLLLRGGEAREPRLEELREHIKKFAQSAAHKLFLGGSSGANRASICPVPFWTRFVRCSAREAPCSDRRLLGASVSTTPERCPAGEATLTHASRSGGRLRGGGGGGAPQS